MSDRYASWELFGKFVCQYHELCKDGELSTFVVLWKHGDWECLDKDWPEWSKFVEDNQ